MAELERGSGTRLTAVEIHENVLLNYGQVAPEKRTTPRPFVR